MESENEGPKRAKVPGSGRKPGSTNRRSKDFERLFGAWLTHAQTVKRIKEQAREDPALMRWLLARQFGNPIPTQQEAGDSLLDHLKALEEKRRREDGEPAEPAKPEAAAPHIPDPDDDPAEVRDGGGWGGPGDPN